MSVRHERLSWIVYTTWFTICLGLAFMSVVNGWYGNGFCVCIVTTC